MKEKIILTALKICEKEGYDSFSMRKLAAKLNLDPMAVYHYFRNKEELTKSMVEQIFNRFQKEISVSDGNPKINLKKVLIAYWNLFIEYPGMSLYLVKNSYDEFPSVISLNEKLQSFVQKSFPEMDVYIILNVIIDFIHGNALASTSLFSKGKSNEAKILANQKEFEISLSYLLDQFSKK
ncbi:TetR/AcrR family transcriptional regulator [Leptospira sp. 2 VSF19]|uniref:TetR/AcrR family transcriptional regulator n=1 Tax=Leptospira soteropolitanensis TaxID=2950025 RepID=A0AAW5VMX7_9LEPT|nr:TetR/AcrR family transcriptional regulator [Leptospira soteropolitanensis]MCW7492480.1 TetR/AcrR family transcriptional regulator [Leptospira soteropolitanensis]MCW7500530.1 TetR/AcrR family transcriptional regulator [Leptospira soteropolitanensis]MCW7522800.1 TetR/AcrR family transcriptional regulator [Leptospira soteropolitanensis]MCW7526658.1 TetR/AcrR family transcriptional regulator [Leptospira soteropolitanensis]MCW7530500.1 TetR/AcrR family transcriptional regulator [Leptospira soter